MYKVNGNSLLALKYSHEAHFKVNKSVENILYHKLDSDLR